MTASCEPRASSYEQSRYAIDLRDARGSKIEADSQQ
jgi:hypothetical protein